MDLALDTRTGWPPELRLFLDRYPRAVWPGHANLGEMARFWLDIHGNFRKLGDALQAATGAFREGAVEAVDFREWFAPRLNYFLGGLEGHHQIEDHQFFPVFGAAEPRLRRGFDVLESDHEVIHRSMVDAAEAANGLLSAAQADRDALLRGAERYADAGDILLKRLIHHLDDEEDLIIPLILERGERALGM